jgi:hypothetical protein
MEKREVMEKVSEQFSDQIKQVLKSSAGEIFRAGWKSVEGMSVRHRG